MKAIMISIKPKWVAKILNGEKTIEIRKTMTKCDLPIDVYIYCTKDKDNKLYMSMFHGDYQVAKYVDHKHNILNGKVVAKFTLNRVVEITSTQKDWLCRSLFEMHMFYHFCKKGCVDELETHKYANGKELYGWHIDNLQIFDRPRELCEFKNLCQPRISEKCHTCKYWTYGQSLNGRCENELTKAPQNFCYVEVEE